MTNSAQNKKLQEIQNGAAMKDFKNFAPLRSKSVKRPPPVNLKEERTAKKEMRLSVPLASLHPSSKKLPDLIVRFDSSGRLVFVSPSVSYFLHFKSSELNGTSFWKILCENSTRRLMGSFLATLANRSTSMTTSPLEGDDLLELKLKDRDGSYRTVTLCGVVHFIPERQPECICSIRLKGTINSSDTDSDGESSRYSFLFCKDSRVPYFGTLVSNEDQCTNILQMQVTGNVQTCSAVISDLEDVA